ncbi:TVP38/TMEM64 family protein [bacterium]|nr:TVP38/TMEM64 family protein [bacterium]
MKLTGPGIDLGFELTRLRRRTIAGIVVASLIVIALAALLIVAQFVEISPGLSTGAVHRRIDAAGPWGPILFLALLAGSILFAPIPNTPFFIAAGLAWGWWYGSLLSLLGMAIGSFSAFVLAQYLTRGTLKRLIGAQTFDRIEPLTQHFGPWAVFWARLLPATNFDWINYLAGLTPMRFLPFAVATMLGILPATVATVAAGAAIERRPLVTLGITAAWLVAFVVSSMFIARRRGRHS